MQVKLLKDVVATIAGSNSVGVVDLLYGTQNVNEFLIAKKLKMTINQTRNILYKLGEEGLVSFIRKKDKKNGGWYTYFWTLDTGRSLQVLKGRIESDLDSLRAQISSKQAKQFYYCPNCGLEISEENALLHDFTCPECGEVFVAKDNTEYLNGLNKNIEDLGKKLQLVEAELVIIGKKEEEFKARKRKREDKRKKFEREIRRKEREREKKKLERKMSRKKSKKVHKKLKKNMKSSKKRI